MKELSLKASYLLLSLNLDYVEENDPMRNLIYS